MKSRVVGILLLVLVVLLSACGSAAATSETDFNRADGGSDTAAAPEAAPAQESAGLVTDAEGMIDDSLNAPTDGSGVDTGLTNPETQLQGQRQIIYTANLTLEVDNPRDTANALYGFARKYGGFVSNGNVYEYGQDADGNKIYRADIQVRIEAGRFDAAQEELRGLANEVVSEQVDTQDVTAQYTDTQSRIANLKRLETELQALLTEARERSDNMDEVLAVYRELSSVREQIEVLQGQLNVLSDLVGLATLNITLIAPTPDTQIAIVNEEWNPGLTMREALRSLTENMQGFVDGTIWFTITTLPQLLIFALVLFVLYRIGRWVWLRVRHFFTTTPGGPTITPPPSGD